MSKIDINSLGFTKEELQERVIDRICAQAMSGVSFDEDGNEVNRDSRFAREINERLKKRVDESINTLAEKYLLPNVTSYIENLCLQETNRWGEKTGQKLTFIEYLTQRADAYIREDVNYEGKSKAESGSYSWSKSQTRIAHLIHEHLHYSIETALKKALQELNSSIAIGLQETVKIKMEELRRGLSVSVGIKS